MASVTARKLVSGNAYILWFKAQGNASLNLPFDEDLEVGEGGRSEAPEESTVPQSLPTYKSPKNSSSAEEVRTRSSHRLWLVV